MISVIFARLFICLNIISFDKHIRDIVNALSSGRVPVQIHFISNLAKGKWKKMEMIKFSFYVVFSFFKRYSLRFTLESPTSVIVHGDIRTRVHNQFQNCFQENSYYYC
ncbi:mediator of RNA polymerase II transcription subunit 17 [Gigaspora margarita]|uniref:Mediator of RNA polymerase II transcription subunit 17 n=1 Tax=Gigaspora margarita TaxID=4874 RepID=A0A8H4EIG7_GIGMA|nr:mediator of RNA polymerase II transcription subunit 17 [Gigaspora margarita]